jgi:hypothetical protein
LVVNCFFRSDTPFIFKLSKSLSPLDNAPFPLSNSPSAYIRVFENDLLFDSFRVKNGVFQGNPAKRPRPNNKYSFECYYPGFGLVKAEDYLPDTLKILNITGSNEVHFTQKLNDSSTMIKHGCKLDIDLESSGIHGNNLMILITRVYSRRYYNGIEYLNEQAVQAEEINRLNDNESMGVYMRLPDNGKPLSKLNLSWDMMRSYKYGHIENEYHISIRSCSKTTYEYLRRFSVHYSNLNDPFAQPIPITSNIDNGFGIFGGVATQDIFLKF